MATVEKHKRRSCVTNHSNESARGWFFNLSHFMARDKASKKKTMKEILSDAKA